MGTRRTIVIVALAMLQVAAASGPRTLRITYAADQRAYSDVERLIARTDTPAGRVTAFGQLRFTPTSDRFTLVVNDAAAAAGRTMPAIVFQYSGRGLKASAPCLRGGHPYTFSGFVPGQEVVVVLDGATAGQQPHTHRCDLFATAGTAMVTLHPPRSR